MSHGRDQVRTQGKRSVAQTQPGGAATASEDAADEGNSTTKRRKVEKQGKNARKKLKIILSRKDILHFNDHSQLKRTRYDEQP